MKWQPVIRRRTIPAPAVKARLARLLRLRPEETEALVYRPRFTFSTGAKVPKVP